MKFINKQPTIANWKNVTLSIFKPNSFWRIWTHLELLFSWQIILLFRST